MYLYLLSLILVCVAYAAEKPSPFVARKSEPAVVTAPPVAPVSPIRGARAKPFAGVSAPPVVGGIPSVAPVVRVAAPAVDAAPAPETAAAPPPFPAIVPTPMVVAVIHPPKPPQVEAVQPGAIREDVIGKLGNPASSVAMYDEGIFVESLRYEWKGAWVGTVRLANGKVRQIDTPR